MTLVIKTIINKTTIGEGAKANTLTGIAEEADEVEEEAVALEAIDHDTSDEEVFVCKKKEEILETMLGLKKEQPQEAEVEEEDLEVASEEDFPVAEASVVAEEEAIVHVVVASIQEAVDVVVEEEEAEDLIWE